MRRVVNNSLDATPFHKQSESCFHRTAVSFIKMTSAAFHEYSSEKELLEEFKEVIAADDDNHLPEYILNSLIDDNIKSIVFDVHYQLKTGSLNVLEGVTEENKR